MRNLLIFSLLLYVTSAQAQGNLPDPLFWGTPSGNDLKAIDQEIQGLSLAMPVMQVEQILLERGYEKSAGGFYLKRQLNDDGNIVRTQRIGVLAVEPSREFIDELEDGDLKDRVLQAQQFIDENRQAAQSNVRNARSRESRTREARGRASRSTATRSFIPGSLELVYLIQYEQTYDRNYARFDLTTTLDQARAAFGPSTFPEDGLRRGMAFNLVPEQALIYHDASLLSEEYRNSLVEAVPEVRLGHAEAVYDALRVPCGSSANPWGAPGGGGCPPGWSDAFPDDLEKQLELTRAVYSPYMRIKAARSGAGIETRLEWVYLQSERGIRERYAEQAARESAPAAELDF